MTQKVWEYAWESDNPEKWSSQFRFRSYEDAKVSALLHALNAHTGKRRTHRAVPDHTATREKLWRSLRRKGWRIRRRLVKAEPVAKDEP